MSRFIGTAKSGGTIAYSAMAAEAILERHQIAITHYKTQGVFGLPLSLGRWGEKLYIKTSDHDTTAPETKGKITIGGICTTNDTIAIAHIIRLCLPMARHFVFVVDTYDRATATNFENELRQQLSEELTHDDNLKIGYNSLEQNFSRQRNIVQALAETPWVLQLDTDETLSPELVHQLGWTITKADNMNVPSVGIPRRNYVDGHLTAHYPDIQYRLNRKKVRYTQPVHETPDVAWYDKVYCWLGHIDHHLASARLQKRSATYEGIEKGAGKPQVLTLLQTPFSLPSI